MSTALTELISALAETTPPMKTVIYDSLNKSLAKSEEKERDEQPLSTAFSLSSDKEFTVEKTITVASEKLSDNEFTSVILDAIESYYAKCYNLFKVNHKEHLKRASKGLNIALILLTIAILIVCSSSLLILFTGFQKLGIIIMIVSVSGEILSLLAFLFSQRFSTKSDKDIKELNTLANIRIAMLCIEQITDIERKNEAVERILKNILLIKSKSAFSS